MRTLKLLPCLALAMSLVWILGVPAQSQVSPRPQLQVMPEKVVLSPDILKEPPVFRGSGFDPGEAVTVDLILPHGVRIKTVAEGESSVGIAFGKANEKGEFECKMAPTAIFNWLFQVEWTSDGKPDMTKASPLAQGKYELKATGMNSDRVATSALEIAHPPSK